MAKGMDLPEGGNFSGWYCKQGGPDGVLALILGRWQSGSEGGCFLQAVTQEGSWQGDLPAGEWWERPSSKKELRPCVRLGKSIFTPEGAWLDMDMNGVPLCGELHYGPLRPLLGDIMGPLRHLPRLECRHLVVSAIHSVDGWAQLGDKRMDFTGGTGYWEGDQGSSFPRRYLWAQCNQFDRPGFAITVAAADVPIGPWEMDGCFCTLTGAKGELRLATYWGAKVLKRSPGLVVIRQRDWCVTLRWEAGEGHPLSAPITGRMTRVIREQADTNLMVVVQHHGEEVLRLKGRQASTEYVD